MSKTIKYVFLSDWHIPDHNRALIKPIFNFLSDYKPDIVYILGDFLNCTTISKYDQDPYYHVSFVDEINEGIKILDKLASVVRKANKNVRIVYKAGNHEARLQKYLAQSAQLAELKVKGEYVNSLPHLMELREKGIEWEEYLESKDYHDVLFEHGDMVRQHSAFTAKGMLEKRGQSGINGHTHRLGSYHKRQGKRQLFWYEIGCLCNLNPNPLYTYKPNWQNGYMIATYSEKTKQFYPQLVPIFENSFVWGEKLYK